MTRRAPPSVSIELEINIAGINVKGKSIFICNARLNAKERDGHRQRLDLHAFDVLSISKQIYK